MFTDSEAQRVIAISLGKIANCRNQRVSSSLHKNLLVANVLQKVRTFVSEDERPFRWEQQFQQCTIGDRQEHMIYEVSEEKNYVESEPIVFHPAADVPGGGHITNLEPVCDSVSDSFGVAANTNVEYECTVSSFSQLAETSRDFKCDTLKVRRLKRRKSSQGYGNSRAKRRKFNTVCDSTWRVPPVHLDYNSDNESEGSDTDLEPSSSCQSDNAMDVEQICSLVSVFKCSFKGLGETSVDTTSSKGVSTCFRFSDDTRFIQELSSFNEETKTSLRRGVSLSDLCAKQADLLCQKFQLTAPVLALTV